MEIADPAEIENVRRFFEGGDTATEVLGVSIGKVFSLAKRFADMPLDDVEGLLDDVHCEVRMAAASIMDSKARRKELPEDDRRILFDVYLRRHDRINNWDLADRTAPHVTGEFDVDKDGSLLEALASSDDPHERRTAIVSTYASIRRDDTDNTFRVAETLASGTDDHVQKAIASSIREADKKDPDAIVDFPKRNQQRLPTPTMTAASNGLPDAIRTDLRRR